MKGKALFLSLTLGLISLLGCGGNKAPDKQEVVEDINGIFLRDCEHIDSLNHNFDNKKEMFSISLPEGTKFYDKIPNFGSLYSHEIVPIVNEEDLVGIYNLFSNKIIVECSYEASLFVNESVNNKILFKDVGMEIDAIEQIFTCVAQIHYKGRVTCIDSLGNVLLDKAVDNGWDCEYGAFEFAPNTYILEMDMKDGTCKDTIYKDGKILEDPTSLLDSSKDKGSTDLKARGYENYHVDYDFDERIFNVSKDGKLLHAIDLRSHFTDPNIITIFGTKLLYHEICPVLMHSEEDSKYVDLKLDTNFGLNVILCSLDLVTLEIQEYEINGIIIKSNIYHDAEGYDDKLFVSKLDLTRKIPSGEPKFELYDLDLNLIEEITDKALPFLYKYENYYLGPNGALYDSDANLVRTFGHVSEMRHIEGTDKFIARNERNRYGIIDIEGNVLVNLEYTNVIYAGGNHISFTAGSNVLVVDKKMNILLDTKATYKRYNPEFFEFIDEENNYHLIDPQEIVEVSLENYEFPIYFRSALSGHHFVFEAITEEFADFGYSYLYD